MKKRNLFVGVFMLAMVAATGGYHAFTSKSSLEENLLMENVEALSEAETSTSWSCIGDDKKCEPKCGLCGTSFKSRGTLNGQHFCKIN